MTGKTGQSVDGTYRQRCTDCGRVATTGKEWDSSGCCHAEAETLERLDSTDMDQTEEESGDG